jgi:hypothetical protein
MPSLSLLSILSLLCASILSRYSLSLSLFLSLSPPLSLSLSLFLSQSLFTTYILFTESCSFSLYLILLQFYFYLLPRHFSSLHSLLFSYSHHPLFTLFLYFYSLIHSSFPLSFIDSLIPRFLLSSTLSFLYSLSIFSIYSLSYKSYVSRFLSFFTILFFSIPPPLFLSHPTFSLSHIFHHSLFSILSAFFTIRISLYSLLPNFLYSFSLLLFAQFFTSSISSQHFSLQCIHLTSAHASMALVNTI